MNLKIWAECSEFAPSDVNNEQIALLNLSLITVVWVYVIVIV
jgi:hypothetical protein